VAAQMKRGGVAAQWEKRGYVAAQCSLEMRGLMRTKKCDMGMGKETKFKSP
jgi:hypothetical protein